MQNIWRDKKSRKKYDEETSTHLYMCRSFHKSWPWIFYNVRQQSYQTSENFWIVLKDQIQKKRGWRLLLLLKHNTLLNLFKVTKKKINIINFYDAMITSYLAMWYYSYVRKFRLINNNDFLLSLSWFIKNVINLNSNIQIACNSISFVI